MWTIGLDVPGDTAAAPATVTFSSFELTAEPEPEFSELVRCSGAVGASETILTACASLVC